MTENEHIVDTNFYALPVAGGSKQQFFPIDIGCDDQFHVNYNAQKVFKTRKVGDEQQRHLHFHTPSIPLTIPTHPYISPTESITKKNLTRHNQIKTTPRILHQYEWYKEHIMLQQSCGLKRGLDSLSWDSVKWSFDKYTKEPSMHRLIPSYSDSIVYDKVEDVYSDIPIPLLHSYIDESCLQDYLSEDYLNIRNCITRWKDNLVIFSSGPYCNEVILVKLVFLDDGLIDTRVFATEDVHSRIFELQCHGDTLFARTCYTVAYYSLIFEDNSYRLEKKKHFTFDQQIHAFAINPSHPNDLVVATQQSCSIVSLKTGKIQQSIPNNHTKDGGELVTTNNNHWQSLLYGSSVSTFIQSWKSGVEMHDFREKPTISHTYLELPSEYLQRTEQLSPVLNWNPLKPYHQYAITTDQALLICDERYRKTPVMKINHFMDTPPQFIQTRLNRESPESCLFVIGSHKKSELMAITLRQGTIEHVPISSRNDASIKIRTPSQLDGHLSKFSSADEWLYQMDDWKLSYQNIFDRCSNQPCLGFIICECPGNEVCMIEETQPCDLFYQKFSCGHPYERESPKRLTNHEEKRCSAWLEATWNLLNNKTTEKDDGKLFSYYDVMDVEEQMKQNESESEILDLAGNQSEESIIIDSENPNHDDTHIENKQGLTRDDYTGYGSNANNLTDANNFTYDGSQDLFDKPSAEHQSSANNAESAKKESFNSNEVWEKLTKLKTTNSFVTRSSLNLPPSYNDIDDKMMTSSFETVTSPWQNYDKPVGKTLLKNWAEGSKEGYTFLEDFAPEINFERLKEDAMNMYGP